MGNYKCEVITVGVGNLSNPTACNTSFLLRYSVVDKNNTNNVVKTYLIDCGYNVLENLILYYPEDLKNLDRVYITHNHADHIGSLAQLIYYRHFKYHAKTYIMTGRENVDPLSTILDLMVSKVYNNYEPSPRNFYYVPYEINLDVNAFKVDHCGLPAYGFVLYGIVFTGDTDILNPKCKLFESQSIIAIFHDCELNIRLPGVHSYIQDIKKLYPKEFKDKLILTHHGLDDIGTVEAYQKHNLKFAQERELHLFT